MRPSIIDTICNNFICYVQQQQQKKHPLITSCDPIFQASVVGGIL